MFSVVIPLYNKANYIQKAIESVLSQKMQAFELIIVDDGSTDNSLQKASRFKDVRIRTVQQSNAGVSVTRNRGVEQANFPYIAFLDADDWWHSEFLMEMWRLILQFPQACLYGSNYYYVKHGQHKVEYKGLPDGFTKGYVDYFAMYGRSFCVPFNCSFVVVQREAFLKAGGFCPALNLGEDLDLWIRLTLTGKVAYLNKPLAYSNQDVVAEHRAIGTHRLHDPARHILFNLGYLSNEEKASVTLKYLIDGLRVRSLLPYYLSDEYTQQVMTILEKVDFARHPFYYRFIYKMPKSLLKRYLQVRRSGADLKRSMLACRKELI